MPNVLLNVPQPVLDAFDRAWRRTPARSRSGLMVRVLSEWAAQQAPGDPGAANAAMAPSAVPSEQIEMQDKVNAELSTQAETIESSIVLRLRHEPWCFAAQMIGGPCSCGAERRANLTSPAPSH